MTDRSGSNRLIRAAHPLLAASAQLRLLASAPELPVLQRRLIQGIVDFEGEAAASGARREEVAAARYLLCTFVDDIASSTPWGGAGAWSAFSLLAHFQREPWGGERVFQLLSRLAESPGTWRDVLELFHVCLSLGLEGQYHGTPDGARQVEEIRARLFGLLFASSPSAGQVAGRAEPLSPQWQPAPVEAVPRISRVPLWAILSVVATVVLVVFVGLSVWLSYSSDQAFARIRSVRFAALPAAAASTSTGAGAVTATLAQPLGDSALATALGDDIRARRIDVKENTSQSLVSVAADQLFEPGTARLVPSGPALLERVAVALAARTGNILVSGHADAAAERSAQYPSVWHLTDAQARAVVRRMQERLQGRTLQSEGLGDVDTPVLPPGAAAPAGAFPARRVDIVLFPGK